MPAKYSRLAIILDKVANENGMLADAVATRPALLAPYGLEPDDVRGVVPEAMRLHREAMAAIHKRATRINWERA